MHADGFPKRIEDLDRVAVRAVVSRKFVHEFHDVAAAQATFRQVHAERSIGVEFEVHAAADASGRTLRISSFRNASICDSRTVTTAMVSPTALKTSSS